MDECNILSLKRRGILEECPDPHPQGLPAFVFDQIDNLGYTYSNNRLQAVNENASELKGYKGTGGTYQYDGGATDGPGNITYDGNKDISIEYNYLNLPEKITFNSQGSIIEWTYDATGRKIKKVVSGSSGSYTQLYLEGVEYKDNQLISIQHEEGRAVPNAEGTGFRQEFVLRDHLGNARVHFSDLNGDGALQPFACNPGIPCVPLGNGGGYTEMLQVQHYYPFGMEFDGPWEMPLDPDEINHYTYNGKELNRDFGLGWLDYGARWYMPEIGRWNAVDPLAEKYMPLSTYNYAVNNPMLYFDPNGKDAIITIDKENKSIQVSQTFHYSRENLSANLKGVPNADASAEITTEEFIMAIYNDFNAQWGSVESTEIDGEEFAVSFSLTLTAHDSNEQRDQAVADDKTSNKLNVLKSAGKGGSWASDTRTLTLGALEMRAGTMSHEIGHSLGLPGHQQGTGEITSYDESRTVQPREVTEALAPAIKLAQGAKGNRVSVHLTGHTTKAWRDYDPSKIIDKK
jgi:RHS repeat-associated protein